MSSSKSCVTIRLNGSPASSTAPRSESVCQRIRKLLPEKFPIRHYPDITHTRQCQYPVPDWDTAFALTDARECINPRPVDESYIFRLLQPDTVGFITYSEGCNDDVNKFIWSALAGTRSRCRRHPGAEYGGYFIGPQHREGFAQGLLALDAIGVAHCSPTCKSMPR